MENHDTMDDLEGKIRTSTLNGHLPCPAAFRIADELGRTPLKIGQEATRLGIKISRCQLGLFGYDDLGSRSIVKPLKGVPSVLKGAIEAHLVKGKLPCRAAWEIAAQLKIGKVQVAGAVEALGIKISSCQLGCFK
jgi:hypothetical protein